MYTLTQSIAEIMDKLDAKGYENWSNKKHLRAIGDWSLAGLLDTPMIIGTTLVTMLGIAAVEGVVKGLKKK